MARQGQQSPNSAPVPVLLRLPAPLALPLACVALSRAAGALVPTLALTVSRVARVGVARPLGCAVPVAVAASVPCPPVAVSVLVPGTVPVSVPVPVSDAVAITLAVPVRLAVAVAVPVAPCGPLRCLPVSVSPIPLPVVGHQAKALVRQLLHIPRAFCELHAHREHRSTLGPLVSLKQSEESSEAGKHKPYPLCGHVLEGTAESRPRPRRGFRPQSSRSTGLEGRSGAKRCPSVCSQQQRLVASQGKEGSLWAAFGLQSPFLHRGRSAAPWW